MLAAAAAPAAARDWAPAGGWTIVEGDDYCAMGSEFEGPGDSELYLILYLNGDVDLSLSNDNWTIKENDELELSFVVNGKLYGGGKAIGAALSDKPGFVTSFKPAFVDDFVKSKSLHVYRGKVVVDELNLAGSAAGMAQTRRCLAYLRAQEQAAAREKARWAHIPDDPFAPPAPPPQRPGGAAPVAALSTLVSPDDYPASAQAAGEQGQVRFRLQVGADGSVSDCDVTQSSGSAALDQATCRIMKRRAKFVPARGEDGKPEAGTFESSLSWSLGN